MWHKIKTVLRNTNLGDGVGEAWFFKARPVSGYNPIIKNLNFNQVKIQKMPFPCDTVQKCAIDVNWCKWLSKPTTSIQNMSTCFLTWPSSEKEGLGHVNYPEIPSLVCGEISFTTSGSLSGQHTIKYPASSTHLATAFISALQYSNTGKGAFDYSHRQFSVSMVSAYIFIEKPVDLI